MKTLSQILVLVGVFAALVGCGNPAPSTPLAPDQPTVSSNAAPPADLSQMKSQEHAQNARQ